ncbi:MAG TPA: VWA domain-containing protein [Fibrobacteria bacterium]|nr:VWA domain-containing protein [Fibrobacteria bacterium]
MKKLSLLCTAALLLVGCETSTLALGDESINEKSGSSDYGTVKTATLSSDKSTGVTVKAGSSDGGSSTSGSQGSSTPIEAKPGQITAAEWNDLSNWDFWLNLNGNADFSKYATYWSYNLNNRVSVHATLQGAPQVDALVELLDGDGRVLWTARTDNKGNAELWPAVVSGGQQSTSGLRARIGTQVFEGIKVNSQGGTNDLILESSKGTPEAIDVAFMVDATGSMSDELDYLTTELKDVIASVRSRNGNVSINTGAVFYRDVTDEYVTKVSAFTSNNSQTIDFVGKQVANNGGDRPEAVHTALDESLNTLVWSSSAKARILFIVLDAPPHYEPAIVSKMHELVRTASAKGVRIVPVACSGIDKETEFLLRYMAIATGGTYVFVTNDSGIGGSHLAASVGDYSVEYLNALMVRLIEEKIK